MGRLPTNNRDYEISHLWDKNLEILRMLATGMRIKDVAEALGVSQATVTTTKNSKIGQEKLAELRGDRDEGVKDFNKRIQEALPKALDVLEDMLDDQGTSESGKIRIAHDFLDRGGYKPPDRKLHLHEHITEDELADMKARRDAAKSQGVVRDEDIQDAEFDDSPSDGPNGHRMLDSTPDETTQNDAVPGANGTENPSSSESHVVPRTSDSTSQPEDDGQSAQLDSDRQTSDKQEEKLSPKEMLAQMRARLKDSGRDTEALNGDETP